MSKRRQSEDSSPSTPEDMMDPLNPSEDNDLESNGSSPPLHEPQAASVEVSGLAEKDATPRKNSRCFWICDMRIAAVTVNVVALLFNLSYCIYHIISIKNPTEKPKPKNDEEAEEAAFEEFYDNAVLVLWAGTGVFSLLGLHGAMKFRKCGLEMAFRYYGIVCLFLGVTAVLGTHDGWEFLIAALIFGTFASVHCIFMSEVESDIMTESNYDNIKYCICSFLYKPRVEQIRKAN